MQRSTPGQVAFASMSARAFGSGPCQNLELYTSASCKSRAAAKEYPRPACMMPVRQRCVYNVRQTLSSRYMGWSPSVDMVVKQMKTQQHKNNIVPFTILTIPIVDASNIQRANMQKQKQIPRTHITHASDSSGSTRIRGFENTTIIQLPLPPAMSLVICMYSGNVGNKTSCKHRCTNSVQTTIPHVYVNPEHPSSFSRESTAQTATQLSYRAHVCRRVSKIKASSLPGRSTAFNELARQKSPTKKYILT